MALRPWRDALPATQTKCTEDSKPRADGEKQGCVHAKGSLEEGCICSGTALMPTLVEPFKVHALRELGAEHAILNSRKCACNEGAALSPSQEFLECRRAAAAPCSRNARIDPLQRIGAVTMAHALQDTSLENVVRAHAEGITTKLACRTRSASFLRPRTPRLAPCRGGNSAPVERMTSTSDYGRTARAHIRLDCPGKSRTRTVPGPPPTAWRDRRIAWTLYSRLRRLAPRVRQGMFSSGLLRVARRSLCCSPE